ncbi:MAG: hypothetical protein GY810_03575 [Aureispira sp.]|nr:hypothetical protein [Aureispira sp.]
MKESGFSIYDKKSKVAIEGGQLWKANATENLEYSMELDKSTQTLSIFLEPQSSVNAIRDGLYEQIKAHSYFQYLYLSISKRLPSLILLIPITFTVLFIGFITIYGDLIKNWIFLLDDADTLFGITQRQSILIYSTLAILVLYFFPVFLTGEQDGFIQAINARFSNRQLVRKRFAEALGFLESKSYIKKAVIWNPNLLESNQDWVQKSLLPALLDANIELVLQIKTDERSTAEHYVSKVTTQENIDWEEQKAPEHTTVYPIPYDYLEAWEKNLLAIYTFASTANLPEEWMIKGKGEAQGVLNNAISLPLVKIIIDRFGDRLFSEEDKKHLISLDSFASRCLNDFGILYARLKYTNDVWAIDETVIEQELSDAQEEMRFVTSYLQTGIGELAEQLNDPVSALLLNSIHKNTSIYNNHRLEAIRFFIRVIRDSEQYKILKQYWELVTQNTSGEGNLNEDIYRIIGVELLDDLATLFERAAMYQHAAGALDYLEMVYPYRGKMGKARIAERQGNFDVSVKSMLEIQKDWKQKEIVLSHTSVVDLHLNLAWAIVSGRLKERQEIGRAAIETAETILYSDFDKIRNSGQIIRLYNILANYEEWEGNPKGSILNYNKALQIPGVEQSGLSNLLVNKGIALRQTKELKEASIYGEQGVEIKTAIGDADQLPIAIHNLAQTYLELAFSPEGAADAKNYFQQAQKHAQTGLDIQDQTGSVKKRGQLFSERFVAAYQIEGEDSPLIKEYLKNAQEWLKGEVNAGRGNSYDCWVVVNELFALLPNFSPKSNEDILNWNLENN